MINIDYLVGKLMNVHRTKVGYIASCPAHDDKSPSFTVSYVDNRILLHCFAGCEITNIVDALGIRISDLYPNDQQYRIKRLSQLERIRYQELLVHEKHVKAMIEQKIQRQEPDCNIDRTRLQLANSRIKKLEAILNG